jgi:hypothetical protein
MGRIGRLELLKALYTKVLIPPSVYREVITEGKRLKKSGVVVIESAIQSGWIESVVLSKDQKQKANKYRAIGEIGGGEAEVLALTQTRKLPVLIDDRSARELAGILGLDFLGTAGVILEAYQAKLIRKQEYLACLAELSKIMWLSPEVITELVKRAGEGRKR